MRLAIETKYLASTNHRGPRVKASCQAGSIVLAWDYALNSEDNHKRAARELICKWGWDQIVIDGEARPLRGYCGAPTKSNPAAYVFVCAVDYAELEL